MATWREINDALSRFEGDHAAEKLHVTMNAATVECKCGVRFASRDKHAACQAWFEHKAVRTAFPDQVVRRG